MLYTPERFGLPSGILGISFVSETAGRNGVVPGMVTVTSCVSV